MGKKLKALAGGLADNQLASTIKESAQQIWLAGLGAFAKAQEEGGKVFDALVREGEGMQSKTRRMTDEKIAQVAGKAAGTWDRLEQVFEDRVARALGSLGVPSRKDIEKLSRRVAELTAVVHELTEEKARAAAKPAAVKAPAKRAARPAVKAAVVPVVKAVAKSAAKPVSKPVARKARAKAAAKPAAKPVALKAVTTGASADVPKNAARSGA